MTPLTRLDSIKSLAGFLLGSNADIDDVVLQLFGLPEGWHIDDEDNHAQLTWDERISRCECGLWIEPWVETEFGGYAQTQCRTCSEVDVKKELDEIADQMGEIEDEIRDLQDERRELEDKQHQLRGGVKKWKVTA